MAWAAIKTGQDSQPSRGEIKPLFQPVAVREKGSPDIPHAPINKARVSHLFCSEDKNNAPPARINPQPQAVAPIGLARSAAATASDPIPINQNGLPVNSSGARSHCQPPYTAASDTRINKYGVIGDARLVGGIRASRIKLEAAEIMRRPVPNPRRSDDSAE